MSRLPLGPTIVLECLSLLGCRLEEWKYPNVILMDLQKIYPLNISVADVWPDPYFPLIVTSIFRMVIKHQCKHSIAMIKYEDHNSTPISNKIQSKNIIKWIISFGQFLTTWSSHTNNKILIFNPSCLAISHHKFTICNSYINPFINSH